jgi:hypothetical protein
MRPQFSIAPAIDAIRVRDLKKVKQPDFGALYLGGSKIIQSHKNNIKIIVDTATNNI